MPRLVADFPASLPMQLGPESTAFPFDRGLSPDGYPRRITRNYLDNPSTYSRRQARRTSYGSGFSRTEDFTHADWTKTNLTATADQTANPADGLVTADKLLETVTNGEHKLSQAYTLAADGVDSVASIFAKWEQRDWIRLLCNDGVQQHEGWFNIRTSETKYFGDVINGSLLNGNFATAGSGGADVFANWTEGIVGGTSTITRDTSVFDVSPASCRFNIDAGGNQAYVYQPVLVPGRKYRVTVRARNGGTGTLQLWDGYTLVASIALTTSFQSYTYEFVSTGLNAYLYSTSASATIWIGSVTYTPLESGAIISPTISNGSFETAGSGGADVFADWSEFITGASTITRDTGTKHSGSAACKFTVDGAGSQVAIEQYLCIPGQRYRLGVWARHAGSGTLNFWDGTRTIFSAALTTSWAFYSVEFVATTSVCNFNCNTASAEVWLDDSFLTPLDLPTLRCERMPAPGDDFFRCSLLFTPRITTGTFSAALSSDGNTLSYAGDTAKGATLWGANIRNGSVPGPYVAALGTARTITAPDCDASANSSVAGADCFAWQVDESEFLEIITSVRAKFSREYARLPAPQSVDDTIDFSRPAPHGLKSGTSYAVAFPDDGDTFRIFSSRKTVSSASTVPGDILPGAMPSGNITLTDSAGHTAVFAANATQPTIQAALNGLAAYGVIASPTCAVSTGRVTVSWNAGSGYMASYSLPGSVTIGMSGGTGVSGFWTFVSTATTTTPDTRSLVISSHGASAGHKIGLYTGDSLVGMGTVAAVIDSDKLSVLCSELSVPDALITHAVFAPQAAVRYAFGARAIRCVRITEFFLPGVTMKSDGTTLASLADVAAVTVHTSAQAWFDRIVAGDALVAVNGSDLSSFAGPICQRTTTYLRMSDALEAV